MAQTELSQTFLAGLELLSQAQEKSYVDIQEASELLNLSRELVMRQPSVVSEKEHSVFVCMADAVLNSITLNRIATERIRAKKPAKTFVYFVSNKSERAIKIGFSSDPLSRISSLQIGTSQKLLLLKVVEGTFKDEQKIHKKFAHLKIHGEWFRSTKELRLFIESLEAAIDS